ncbi:TetR family transcriptional regulator [Prauserella shujinwangii]|uniref:TetR family transcriptional regulator n=1 Tax=Prauserella shujinwangii TaxID=1453103 RepID=A0A2T0LXJ3_9PSEU|nr:TetR family transcriptional regulator [Prauserella shujinwangii]PRX48743.1 TetR family transcriptional regulator [Prauserella shujinwangii]
MPESHPGLRERKKQQTRRALIETAYHLFERDGYEPTTVARIAEAAGVSTATFFNYFPSKEDLLFPDSEEILAAGLAAITRHAPGDDPVDVLAGAVRSMISATKSGTRDPAAELETRRLRLVLSVPQLRARLLERSFGTLRELAAALLAAYPDAFDEVEATAMLGAVFGAALAAGSVSVQRDELSEATLTRSVDLVTRALRAGWR